MLKRGTAPTTCVENLVELLELRARNCPELLALSFLDDQGREESLRFAELERRARMIAASLQETASPGDRALLLYPPGLEFVCAFFGCLYAGVLAVPATYPRPRRPMPRLYAIAKDAGATIGLTTAQTLAGSTILRGAAELKGVTWLATDSTSETRAAAWSRPDVRADDLAFLQYTSGSTSMPKGVMVSHRNLLHNLELISNGFGLQSEDVGVFWLPGYHDMGLIGGILAPLYVGGRSHLMAPTSFLRRPLRWLQAISRYQATVSGAPNFAYDFCVEKTTPQKRDELDLSRWRVAFCGAEPIRAETLERFADAFGPCGFDKQAFYPCYGLAESTLLAAGGDGPAFPAFMRVDRRALADHRVEKPNGDRRRSQRLVSCGRGLMDQEIVIVDNESMTRSGPGRVGEIWIRGDSVAQGYWNRPEENTATFGARLADTGEGPFLRTGDLGFFDDEELFVTGRLKDVVIIRGRNHYPQDIEQTVDEAHPALRAGVGAAFSIEVDGDERLVTLHEVHRHDKDADLNQVMRAIRRAIAQEHELEVYAVVLIRKGTLPVTSSGKTQRFLCREHYLKGRLYAVRSWVRPSPQSPRANGRPLPRINGTSLAGQVGPVVQRPSSSRSAFATAAASPEETARKSEQIAAWLSDWLVHDAGVAPEELDLERPFAEYGLDSLKAVELIQELEDRLQVTLTPVVAWNYPTPAALARYLAEELTQGQRDAFAPPAPAGPQATSSEFEELLAEIETLSEHEVEAQLDRELRSEPAEETDE